MTHTLNVRVYFQDTDAGGIVYHASYLNYGERARTELLRSMGYENKSLHDKQEILFVVRQITAEYIAPAFLDDLLIVKSKITQLKNASFTMNQAVFRNKDMIFSVDLVLVSIDSKKQRPVPLPQDIRLSFETFMKDRS
jgi:acyl-CoA thioester hydrolase